MIYISFLARLIVFPQFEIQIHFFTLSDNVCYYIDYTMFVKGRKMYKKRRCERMLQKYIFTKSQNSSLEYWKFNNMCCYELDGDS
jgi:hypothetical protein